MDNTLKLELFRQAAIAQGHSAEDVDKFIQQQQEAQAQADIYKSQGQVSASEALKNPEAFKQSGATILSPEEQAQIEIDNAVKKQQALDAIKQKTPKALTEGEKTKRNLANSGLKALNNLNDIYSKDPEVLKKQLIPGKFQSRQFDSALFGAVDTLLRIRTGATAPESEIRKYMSAYGPKFGDSPEDVAFKMAQLRTALVSEGGLPEQDANKIFAPEKIKIPEGTQKSNSLIPSVKLPQEIDLSTPQAQQDVLTKILSGGANILQQGAKPAPAQIYDSPIGKFLFPTAHEVQSTVQSGNMPTPKQGLRLAGEAGLNLVGAGGVGAIASKLPRVLKPIATAGKARTGAVEELEKAGELIINDKLKGVAQAMKDAKIPSYLEKPLIEKLRKGQGIKPTEAMELLKRAGDKTFTKGGDFRSNQAADFYQILREGIRDEFTKKAPKVIEETTRIAKAMPKRADKMEPAERALKKIINPITVGAGITGAIGSGAAYALLNKLQGK